MRFACKKLSVSVGVAAPTEIRDVWQSSSSCSAAFSIRRLRAKKKKNPRSERGAEGHHHEPPYKHCRAKEQPPFTADDAAASLRSLNENAFLGFSPQLALSLARLHGAGRTDVGGTHLIDPALANEGATRSVTIAGAIYANFLTNSRRDPVSIGKLFGTMPTRLLVRIRPPGAAPVELWRTFSEHRYRSMKSILDHSFRYTRSVVVFLSLGCVIRTFFSLVAARHVPGSKKSRWFSSLQRRLFS